MLRTLFVLLYFLLIIQSAYSTVRNSFFYGITEHNIHASLFYNSQNDYSLKIFLTRQFLNKALLATCAMLFFLLVVERFMFEPNYILHFLVFDSLFSKVISLFDTLSKYNLHYVLSILSVANFSYISNKANSFNELQKMYFKGSN